jgi:hypothetical protein
VEGRVGCGGLQLSRSRSRWVGSSETFLPNPVIDVLSRVRRLEVI